MIPFVGLTGGIASGKTSASVEFARLGVPIVDADEAGHVLLEAGGRAVPFIGREFGTEFLTGSGAVDRDLLRQDVFADEHRRNRLEALMHPLIDKECRRLMRQMRGVYGLLVAPLMFEKDFMLADLERVLVIDVDEELQFQRGLERGRFSAKELRAAMKAQIGRQERKQRADDQIENKGGDFEILNRAVQEQHKKYMTLFA